MKYSLKTIKTRRSAKLPRLLIISGVHGNETNAIVSSMIVKESVEHDKKSFSMYSSITFLIGLNEYGIRNSTRKTGNDYDKSDLNRLFFEEYDYKSILKSAINDADIVVDVHNSPNIVNLILLNWDGDCKAFQEHFFWRGIQTLIWNSNTPTIKNYVNSINNKVGFTVELSGMGMEVSAKENAKWLEKVIMSLSDMNKFKNMIAKGKLDQNDLEVTVKTRFEGILEPSLKVGDKVTQGQQIGSILNYDNEVLEKIRSPTYGTIVTMSDTYFIKVDGMVCQISKC